MKSTRNYLVFLSVLLQTLFCAQIGYGINDGTRYTNSSKLAQGRWIKIKVGENAIYKLTYEKLVEWGLDPAKTKVFGYGGWPLSEDFTQPYLDDLPEVACWKSGPTEVFNPEEFLLFYGRGVTKWGYANGGYVHENNPYSTYGAYFLTDDEEGDPKRMTKMGLMTIAGAYDVDFFEDYMLHEKDEVSIAHSGRELYGENFAKNNVRDFPFTIPGILNDAASVSLSFATRESNPANLSLSVNDGSGTFHKYINTNISIPPVDAIVAVGYAYEDKKVWGYSKNVNTIVRVEHACGTNSAYLNYIRLNMTRTLQYYNTAFTFFRNNDYLYMDLSYKIGNAKQDLLVFDITDNYDAKLIETDFDGVDVLSFDISQGSILKEFALVDPTKDFPIPQMVGQVENQNLHGFPQIDMAIISPKTLLTEAETLAQEHITRSNLIVKVVTPEQIYNEFSSGTPDATAYRRFMKMFFDRGITDNDPLPKYLLLFGDGMYDNRFLDLPCQAFNKDNFLLTYQARESLKKDDSYLCDDYFGFLDENEEIKSTAEKKLMLGIGRFPVQTPATAKSAVDKTISYMENKGYGIWKNSVAFVADNSDSQKYDVAFTLHMKQSDSIAYNLIQKLHPEYMVSKIYMDAFKPEVGGTSNVARRKLLNSLNDGCLVFNYTGHGGPVGLAHNVFTLGDVPNLSYKNLPLWITSTCDFTVFDSPATTIGEELFLHKNSGAIALITSTRVVYAQENVKMNYHAIQSLFTEHNGKMPTLGEAFMNAKNNLGKNNNKLSYVLIGDPALRLNYPEPSIKVVSINNDTGVDGTTPITLKALEAVNVKGYVTDKQGLKDTNFNGTLFANIYDGIQTLQTVTATTSGTIVGYRSEYTDYPNLISPAYCNVENGDFEFDFTVMKDIAGTLPLSLGKMNMYAYNGNTGREVNSSFMNYNVFGIDESLLGKTSVPIINSIHLNDISSLSAPNIVVNETPLFVAEVSDELGINMSGAGIGHDILLIIDNSPAKTYNLNSFYKASASVKNTGTITYPIPALSEGKHTLTFRVWNILNNVAVESFEFEVEKKLPRTYDLNVNKNPAKIGTGTSFAFSHSKPENHLELNVSVFDLSGRLVWSYKKTASSDLMCTQEILWNLKNDKGIYVQPGVYLYNACVKSEGSVETTQTKKMIVVGQ